MYLGCSQIRGQQIPVHVNLNLICFDQIFEEKVISNQIIWNI
jgi:hypothetical protein